MAVTPFGRPEMLIGQAFKIVLAYSTAIIQCQCEGKATLMLAALNRSVACPACGNRYAIAASGQIQVGQILREPTDPEPAVVVQ